MSPDFYARIIGLFVFGISGIFWGVSLSQGLSYAQADTVYNGILFGLVGALTGLILTPFLSTRPARYIRRILAQVDAQTLVAGLVGLIVGLVIAALLAFPLSL